MTSIPVILRRRRRISVGPTGPTNTVAPVVSGTATVGQTLSTTNGTWTGVGTITYAYQWLDDGAAISGATSSTYTLTASEEGGFISCRVTATDDNGSTAATSNSLGPVAAGAFALTDLYSSGQAGWLFTISPSTCFQDAARTTAAAVGDPVGGVTDQSGNGNHATQTVSASRPVLRQDASSNYYLEFDGVDDFLSVPVVNISGSGSVHAGVLSQSVAGGFGGALVGITDVSGYQDHYGTTAVYSSLWSTSRVQIASAVDTTVTHIASMLHTGTNLSLRMDGSAIGSGAAVTADTSVAASYVGADAMSGYNLEGRIYSALVRVPQVTGTDLTNTEAELAALSGVTL